MAPTEPPSRRGEKKTHSRSTSWADTSSPANPPPAFKGHDLPRLRGVMSPNEFREDDLRVLGTEWNANLIRWQITRNWGKAGTDRDLADYDRWFDCLDGIAGMIRTQNPDIK